MSENKETNKPNSKGEQYSNDWIQCSSCGVETPCFDTPEEAAEAWNRRK